MNVKSLKLITGEDIISEIEDMGDTVVLNNPVQVSVVPNRNSAQPTFGFLPFPLTSGDKKLTIKKDNVVFFCEPAEDFLNQYNQLFGTGIVTPTKSLIL